MVKSIIKRIIVSVGVIVSLAFLSQYLSFLNIFNINVYAKTDDVPFKVGVINTSGSNTKISSLDGVYSNIFDNDSQNPLNTFSYYLFGVDTSTCQEDTCDLVSDPVRKWYSYNDLTDNLEFRFPYQGSSDVTYLGSIGYTFFQQFKLTNSNHYTIMLAIYKSSNDIRFNTNLNPNLTGLNVTIGNGTSERSIISSVENLQVSNHIYHSEIGRQSHWATISVDFDLDSNFDSFANNEDVWLSSLVFDINSPKEGFSNIGYPFNNILYFPSNKSNDVYLKNYLYVIENGEIYYTGVDCDENSNSCHSGSSFTSAMDYTSFEDIEVLNSIPVCGDEFTIENIICHIKRVFTMIEKFFVRISNFFKELFNSSITWDLDSNSNMTPVSDLLTMPITLINSFINGFNGQCSSYTLGTLYNYTLTLPCINLRNYIGNTLFVIVDGLISMFMLLNIGRLIITFFDKSTSLDDMFGLLYHVHDYEVREANDYVNGVVR